ncbi:hypothetical protein [Nocardia miyunensis]|uniref:hypothetical protein n=1 Tax=Nocardia miyunensis TaxID=282684 RepID=UPI000829F5F8|nr:hypothetical protein [Nocardia miyunensis]
MESDGVREAETAARWWTARLSPWPDPSIEQIVTFHAALREDLLRRIREPRWCWPQPAMPYEPAADPPLGRGLMSYARNVHCDFDPGDVSLLRALDAASIRWDIGTVLPEKTTMWINPGLVLVHPNIPTGPVSQDGLPETCETIPLAAI